MKHIKLFENTQSISSMMNIADKYHEILKYLKPAVVQKYNDIANDNTIGYGQDIVDVYGGDSFYDSIKENECTISDMKMHDNKIFFTLTIYKSEDVNTNYIPFETEEELEQAIIKLDTKKYNI